MSFPRYPNYKDSGVEWLGEVPEHWCVNRLKHRVRLLTQKTDRREHALGLENIESWSGRYIPTESEFEGDGVAFEAGDLLFGKLRPYLAKVYLAEAPGEAVGDFHVMRPVENTHPRFAQYLMLNGDFIALVDGSTFGSKMPRASWEFVGGMQIGLPPLNEQLAIATFLDQEMAKIDALVAEQRRLIELLKEKRQAVISHAVTKGLNPDAPMKPSGIEWLGDVPAHWEVCRLKYVSPQITVGIVVEPSKYYVEKGVPALRSLNVAPGAIKFDNMVFLSDEAHVLHSKSRLSKGDLVAVRSGQPGTTAVIPAELDNCNCVDLIIIRKPTSGCESFLCWFLSSDFAVIQFSQGSGGAIQQHFNVTTAANLLVTVPPLAEQHSIDTFIKSRVREIDDLIEEAQHAIDLLQERRTALISAAVTGKIDVRKLAKAEAA